eukprot:CFRG3877T1
MTVALSHEEYLRTWHPTWSEWLLLPPGVHWNELEDPKYAKLYHLLPAMYLCIAIVIIRVVLEEYCFPVWGYYLGIHKINTKYTPHPELEEAYRLVEGHASGKYTQELAKRTGMTEKEIRTWFRRKKNSTKATPVKKFSESLFKVFYYTSAFVYGVVLLYNRPWTYDLYECFRNLPFHPVDAGVTTYYIIQLGYYVSCLVMLPWDNKRKDFAELVIHHLATVALVFFSWYTNYWKVGTIVMVIHDAADVFLEVAKTFNYAGFQDVANHGFTLFAIVFFVTRLVLFPICINSILSDPVREFFDESFYDYVVGGHIVVAHVIFSSLLCVLLVLHVFWFSIIAKMAVSMITTEPVSKDVRSDDEYGFTTDDDSARAPTNKEKEM